MNKIIGGLLVATLMSNSPLARADFISYQILQAQTVIIAGIQKEREEREKELEVSDLNEMLDDIDKNSREINTLLKNKYDIISKIKSILNLKAHTKTNMNDYQISAFQEFNSCYCRESEIVNKTLDSIETKQIEKVKKELCKNNSNYASIYERLKTICDCQYDAIYNLNRIIDMGCKTLAII